MLAGCLALAVIVLGVLLLFTTTDLSFGAFFFVFLLILGAGAGVFFWVFNYQLRRSKEDSTARQNAASSSLQRTHRLEEVFVNVDADKFVGINWSNEEIVAGGVTGSVNRFNFAQLADVEMEIGRYTVSEDDFQTTTDRGSQIIGAAAGGALFGPVGVVVGGLSGSKSTSGSSYSTEGISTIDLRMRFRDRAQPIIEIPFYNVDRGPVYAEKQGERLDAARRFHACLSNILDEKKLA